MRIDDNYTQENAGWGLCPNSLILLLDSISDSRQMISDYGWLSWRIERASVTRDGKPISRVEDLRK